jgi:FxsC-like protein
VDPWAVTLPEHREILQRVDVMENPWVQVVVVWNQRDPQLRAERERLEAALNEALPRKLSEAGAISLQAARGVPSLEEFGRVFPQVIAEAGRRYRGTALSRLAVEP